MSVCESKLETRLNMKQLFNGSVLVSFRCSRRRQSSVRLDVSAIELDQNQLRVSAALLQEEHPALAIPIMLAYILHFFRRDLHGLHIKA